MLGAARAIFGPGADSMMVKMRIVVALAAAASGVACKKAPAKAKALAMAPTVAWTATDLGIGRCVATNAKGQILGVDDANQTFVVTADGTRSTLPGAGDALTIGTGIDDQGVVFGYSETATGRSAVRYTSGAWAAIPQLGSFSAAIAASGDGAVVGVTRTSDGSALQGFLFASEALATIPLPTDRSSIAQAAAPGGLVAGVIEAATGESHAFRIVKGTLEELGTLGGVSSSALAISANGDTVGSAEATTGERHAFFCAAGSRVLVDLGLPQSATNSDARGIDAKGRIAGNADFADGSTHPFIFVQGAAAIDLLPRNSATGPYSSAHAAAIAADGRVVGWGVAKGAGSIAHCLSWTPGS